MELIIEFILSLFIEGSFEVGMNKKISKWIRYPLLFILIGFYSILIIGLVFLGIKIITSNLMAGIFFIVVGLLIGFAIPFGFKRKYKEINKGDTNENKK